MKSLKIPEIISKVGSPFNSLLEELEELTMDTFDSGFEIEVLSGIDMGSIFVLNKKEIILGRAENNETPASNSILFRDPTVSHSHAVLRWEDELDKYVIFHLSDSSPTMVNSRIVKKSLLGPDYIVTLGEMNFRIISKHERMRKESQDIWQKFKSGEERGEKILLTGYKLVVVEGPDKGKTFDLDMNLMIIGKRKGPGDIRDTYGILLTDKTLPEELALLVWLEKEKRFCIYQSEESTVPLQLFRVVETGNEERVAGNEYQNVLEDKDSIMAGETVMVIHKLSHNETREAKVDIEKEISGITDQKKGNFEDFADRTAFSSFRVDYVFEVVDGPDTGYKISLLSDEMTEGRIITFGTSGEGRANDIELDDSTVANIQGYLEFTGNCLYLINEAAGTEILVNTIVVGYNEKIELNGGDRIKIGNTIIAFTDNRILSALRNFQLEMVSGVSQDKAKTFPVQKTTIYIGRGSACEIRVHDPEVSRLHVVLSFKGGRFHLEHKSKVNPTFVNGISLKKAQDRIIFPGDKIYLSGKTILQLVRTKA